MRNVLALLVLSGCSLAAPPKLVVPPDLKPVGGYVRFTPDTDAKSVLYVSLDDAYPFPSDELKDSRRFLLPVGGLKAGRYRFVAVGTKGDEQTATPFTVVIGDTPADPVKPPTDVKKVERVAVVVVEESQARTVDQAKSLNDLRKWCETSGSTLFVVDKDDPAAAKNGYLTHAKELPAVLVFDAKGGAGLLRVVRLDTDTVNKVKEVVK